MSLDSVVLDRAMSVKADDASHSTSRAIIDGAVVIYNLDDPPAWLTPILDARDEDGHIEGTVAVRKPRRESDS